MDLFDAIEAKIDRAGEHVEALYGEVGGWAQGNPGTVLSEPEGASREHRIYVRFDPQPDPTRWGLIFGDAIHCLRSALDHIVYALAVRETGSIRPPGHDRLEFPILDDPRFWNDGSPKLTGVASSMRAAIKSVQPFEDVGHDPHANTLWVLREFDNIDKHRTITPVGVLPEHFVSEIETVTGGELSVSFLAAPLKDEATVMTISGEAITKVRDHHRGALLVCVELPVGPPGEINGVAMQIFDRVVGVAKMFEDILR